jgi:hypothetical protein
VIGLQFVVQSVTFGMLPPIPLLSWSRQRPPGAAQSVFEEQNLSHMLTVGAVCTQSVPGAH